MDDSPTPLSLPISLPYPINLTRLLARPHQSVSRGTPLLEYTFTSDTSRKALLRRFGGVAKQDGDEDARENDMVGSWESPIEGDLAEWASWVVPGSVVERKHAGKEVVSIQQACTHPVQLHGMCGICGADLTTDDYLSRPNEESQTGNPSKKGHEMSHDALGVTVSTNEAIRLENQARDMLLSQRKLSLIVDLDQTIIHTTVDPTVGEWMAEIARTKQQEAEMNDSTTPPGSQSGSPSATRGLNPNAEALQDVARFQLSDDVPPGFDPKKFKNHPGHDRWYFTKPRPGLPEFLQRMNKLYEMHVYTMGTRTYADAICKVVDPNGQYFGDRILSRDENGSFNTKSLKRLFPTDQSMVVIIDDRADVWSDSPNLVKVVPYDFFLGIGDINSAFLPPNPNKPIPNAPGSGSVPSTGSDQLPEDDESSVAETKKAQTEALNQLSESRPLAKLQEKLDAEEDEDPGASSGTVEESNGNHAGSQATAKSTTPPASPAKPRKPLLNPNDDELVRVAQILTRIHTVFYDAYDDRTDRSPTAKLPLACDCETIIPDIKSTVLEDCTIVFTGVIARHERPESSHIFAQAEAFGAQPVVTLSPEVTHCVTAIEGTEKAIMAQRMGIPVLWVGWFYRCVALWEHIDEREWLVNPPKDQAMDGEQTRPASEATTPAASGSLGLGLVDGPTEEDMIGNKNRGWDEEYQKELQAMLDGSSDTDDDTDTDTDDGTDDGSVGGSEVYENRSRTARSAMSTPGPSPPGTPRKRVRYADEESLPLESFKELPPPKKKKKPLLLGAPSEDDGVPEANKIVWKGKLADQGPEAAESDQEGSKFVDASGDDGDYPASSEAGTEDEDDFAKMLADSMDE